MRNWNKSSNLLLKGKTRLRAYLWGIETNFYFWKGKLPQPHVASLPMRNWNFKMFQWGGYSPHCCEPTYEELKLGKSSTVTSSPLSCEPTYEELKQKLQSSLWFHYNSCEPTYEELKHLFLDCRDVVDVLLRAYLWGIETTYSLRIDDCGDKLRAYLWGIETTS